MNAVRMVTGRQLVVKSDDEAQFYILDVYQSLELVSKLEERLNRICDNIQYNAEQSGEDNGYQPMINIEQADNDGVSTDSNLGMKLPLKNPENNNSGDLSLDSPIQNWIWEDEIPTC